MGQKPQNYQQVLVRSHRKSGATPPSAFASVPPAPAQTRKRGVSPRRWLKQRKSLLQFRKGQLAAFLVISGFANELLKDRAEEVFEALEWEGVFDDEIEYVSWEMGEDFCFNEYFQYLRLRTIEMLLESWLNYALEVFALPLPIQPSFDLRPQITVLRYFPLSSRNKRAPPFEDFFNVCISCIHSFWFTPASPRAERAPTHRVAFVGAR